MLAFVAGKVDMTFPTEMTATLEKDIKSQDPTAVCEIAPINVSTNLIINRENPPFNNLELRKAMALSLDRKAFIDIILQGQGDQGGTLLPPPEGVWGLPPAMLKTIPGYGDVKKDREQARAIMTKLGYSADKPLKIKVSTRNLATYRDPAVVLDRPAHEKLIDAELDPVNPVRWFASPRSPRNDYSVGLEPDRQRHRRSGPGLEIYALRVGAQLANPLLQQGPSRESCSTRESVETDLAKRKKMVWDIDKKLQEDVARPILFHAPAPAPVGSPSSRI